MVDVDKLTDAELRTKLMEFGFPALPITGTTRKVMVKKLKLLVDNKNTKNIDARRSLGKYSSEDDSDTEVKAVRNKRRVTMAAAPMQPPAKPPTLKKTTRIVETTIEEDIPKITQKTSMDVSSSRASRMVKSVQNEYDTGSDSESEIIRSSHISSSGADKTKQYQFTSSVNSAAGSLRESPKKSLDTSYSRTFSSSIDKPAAFSSPVLTESSSDRLNQIRSRMSVGNSGFDRTSYSSPAVETNWSTTEKEHTPFLSNFTKRLSQLSASKYRNEVIKEQDTNGANLYMRSPQFGSSRSTLRPREYQDYGRSNNEANFLKDNLVPFTVLLVALLFFLLVGFIYLGMRTNTSLETTGLNAPICDFGKKPNPMRGVNCVLEGDVEKAINLLKPLKAELKKRAVEKYCENSDIKDRMQDQDVVDFIERKFKLQNQSRILTDLRNLQVLVLKNPSWGISIVQAGPDEEIKESNIIKTLDKLGFERVANPISMTILHPDIPWTCSMAKTFYTLARTILILIGIFGVVYVSNLGYKRYNLYQRRRRNEIIGLVEKILEVLQGSEVEDNYYVINHVRDMIIPVNERKAKDKIWKKAVEFINENESRVRTEIQVVQGEEYLVWRWVGSNNLSLNSTKNKSWQGQAFETQTGAVNSLLCSPTPCLKIRGMVEEGDRNTSVIRQAVLSKCTSKCRILHCSVDTKMKCVYMKCADTQEAAVAYQNLHGWWYAGQLVTVKYVRLERYMQRFPDSPSVGPPYLNENWMS